jgi:hypothetical protein
MHRNIIKLLDWALLLRASVLNAMLGFAYGKFAVSSDVHLIALSINCSIFSHAAVAHWRLLHCALFLLKPTFSMKITFFGDFGCFSLKPSFEVHY